jgi:hypothetical protein
MAAQSTFEAQSFADHTSAPSSTTTSLATPSAMSTACDGGKGMGYGRQRNPTLPSGSVALLRCSRRSCLGPMCIGVQACIRWWWVAALLKTATLATGRAAWLGIDVSKSTEVGESLVAAVTVYSRSTVAMSASTSPICARKTEARRQPRRHCRAAFYCVAGYRRPPPPLWRRSGCVRLRASQRP